MKIRQCLEIQYCCLSSKKSHYIINWNFLLIWRGNRPVEGSPVIYFKIFESVRFSRLAQFICLNSTLLWNSILFSQIFTNFWVLLSYSTKMWQRCGEMNTEIRKIDLSYYLNSDPNWNGYTSEFIALKWIKNIIWYHQKLWQVFSCNNLYIIIVFHRSIWRQFGNSS